MVSFHRVIDFFEKHDMDWLDFYKIHDKFFDIIFLRDADLRTVWTNKENYFLDEYDTTEEKFYNQPCYKALFNLNGPINNCPVYRSKQTGKLESAEVKLPNGNIKLARSYPLKNDNKIYGFIQICINITEKRNIKKSLNYKNKKLKKIQVQG